MKQILFAMLFLFTAALSAQTIFSIESPKQSEIYSGILSISGWAISDVGIDHVEFWKDGTFKADIPYGGIRRDVYNAHPNYPDSLYSGFNMKWAYSLFGIGSASLKLKFYDNNGGVREQTVNFDVAGFTDFIRDGEIQEEIILEAIPVKGVNTDIILSWNQVAQQYTIVYVEQDLDTLPTNITETNFYPVRIVNAVNEMRSRTVICGSTTYLPASPVTWNNNLAEASMRHSIDMASNNFFSHTGSDGSSYSGRVYEAGYTGQAMGEVIAAGSRSPEGAVSLWESSPGHCALLMNPYVNEIGHGMARGSGTQYGSYWTLNPGRG